MMNSDDKTNGILEEASAGIANSDSNANISDSADHSKGAIPKTKPLKVNTPNQKKNGKINNNIEDMRNLNGKINTKGYSMPGSILNTFNCPVYNEKPVCDDSNVSCNKTNGDYSYLPSQLLNVELDLSLNCINRSGEKFIFDSDSSSDDTELLSVSDDGCIYTYKGDNVADLPDSFFSLEIPPLDNHVVPLERQENSSPEMDFLEMDFDPGILGDADSDSISNTDLEQSKADETETNSVPIKTEIMEKTPEKTITEISENTKVSDSVGISKGCGDINLSSANCVNTQCKKLSYDLNFPKRNMAFSHRKETKMKENIQENVNLISAKMPWSCVISERTTGVNCPRYVKRHQSSNGELISPTLSSPSTPQNILNVCHLTHSPKIKKVMIWNEEEASQKQVIQIGASACGATAILNVLKALRYPLPSKEKLQEVINTRLRANNSMLVKYLLSRSVAGATHDDLITGLCKISEGSIYARFFPMYPERVVNLYKWLVFWIENGAIPIATLNLQKNLLPVPDAWHHQMIHGVGPEGVFLTNPLECVEAGQLWPQLCSESVLLVKREDVLSRWNPMELKNLMKIGDVRWRRLNVVGQVANMIRESLELRPGFTNTSHIRIPASYQSGITLAVEVKSPAFSLLNQCPDLPLLYSSDMATALPNM